MVKSRYEEDVFDNNHTSVFGSWFEAKKGRWGYKCCKSTIKNSYCLSRDEEEEDQEEEREKKSSFGDNSQSTSSNPSSIAQSSTLSSNSNETEFRHEEDRLKRGDLAKFGIKEDEMISYHQSKQSHLDPMMNYKDENEKEEQEEEIEQKKKKKRRRRH